jgi:hypothetical protein
MTYIARTSNGYNEKSPSFANGARPAYLPPASPTNPLSLRAQSLTAWDLIDTIASRLGGDRYGNSLVCPGPGHSDIDRSMSVSFAPDYPSGFIVNSFSSKTSREACVAHVHKALDAAREEIAGTGVIPVRRP